MLSSYALLLIIILETILLAFKMYKSKKSNGNIIVDYHNSKDDPEIYLELTPESLLELQRGNLILLSIIRRS